MLLGLSAKPMGRQSTIIGENRDMSNCWVADQLAAK
jgi:hypothetical protein